MSNKQILIGIIVVLLVVLGFVTMSSRPKEKVNLYIGFQGMARINDYLAAQRFMEKIGYQIQSSPRIPVNLAKASIDKQYMFGSSIENFTESEQRAILDWVARGGQAVVGLNPAKKKTLRFRIGGQKDEKEDEGDTAEKTQDLIGNQRLRDSYLMNKLGIKVVSLRAASSLNTGVGVNFGGENYQLSLNSKHRLSYSSYSSTQQIQDSYGTVGVSVPWGRGSIIVLSDLSIFNNHKIKKVDHAAFFAALLTQSADKVVLIYRNGLPSFLSIFYQQFYLFVYTLSGFILIALWRYVPRFGRIVATQNARERKLKEHIDASAQFNAATVNYRELAGIVKDKILPKIKQHCDPGSRFNDTSLIPVLAKKIEMREAQIRELIITPELVSGQSLLRIVNTSIVIGNKL